MKKALPLLGGLLLAAGCSGIRTSGDAFTVHADSLNLIGFQIPSDDYERAKALVPAGAEVNTVTSTPSDWTSFLGVLNRILGASVTEMSGKTSK